VKEEIKDEKEIIIAVIENFLCDAVRGIQTPTPDLRDDVIDKTFKNFMGIIHGTATKLPKTRFALALPIMRTRHEWYMERYKGLCRTFVPKKQMPWDWKTFLRWRHYPRSHKHFWMIKFIELQNPARRM
jgi:hypothetical protein